MGKAFYFFFYRYELEFIQFTYLIDYFLKRERKKQAEKIKVNVILSSIFMRGRDMFSSGGD